MRIDKNTTIRLGNRNIVKVKLGDVVIWQKTTGPVVGPDYFYIESLGDGNTISVKNQGNGDTTNVTPTLEYSTDKNTWNTITFDWTNGRHTTELPVKLNTGEKMYFRNDTGKFSGSYNKYITFSSSVSSNVGGDIRTLSNYLDVDSETKPQTGMFYYLFYNNQYIVDASNLRLPYTTLENGCYSNMFQGCSSLTTTPTLPDTTLADYCYQSMFSGCSKLTTAPELPATTLARYCYSQMFYGCTSLTTAPALPATTLADNCYTIMFSDCTSLTTAPALPATTLASDCYNGMFKGCTSLTTAPELPATTLATNCYYEMFQGCSKLTVAHTLPATTLAPYCYYSMFENCTSLTTAPTLPAPTLESYCYNRMFLNCTSLTIAPTLPATTLASSCYNAMFFNCSKLTTAPALPATTLASDCYFRMFYGCTSLTTAPELPATTLASYCYRLMFEGCTSLNNVTVYADDISASGCTDNWLKNVASTGTFNNMGSATYTTDSPSGIPTGWTEVKPVEGPDYFYIESLGDGNTISVVNKGDGSTTNVTPTLEYSTDKNTWNTITFDWTKGTHTTELPVKLNTGGKMYFRNDTRLFSNSYEKYISFSSTVSSNVGGDIRTLSNYLDVNSETRAQAYMFRGLFYNNKYIVNASNLKLPYTTLASNCYSYIFGNCTSLTTAPELPATTLASRCYYFMFYNCTSLTTAPSLPTITLAESCYDSMFYGCTSLTTAPELPATTLADYCYSSMFNGCTSLTTAPALPATTLANTCYNGMFRGCTSLTTAPELPATTLTTFCYNQIFKNCTSLNNVTVYADDISASNCTKDWLLGVASTGTFNNMGSATYTANSPSGIPSGWTEVKPVVGPDYFYIESLGDGNTISVINKGNGNTDNVTPTLEYSTDKNTWNTITFDWTSGEHTTELPILNTGGKMYFRNDTRLFSNSSSKYISFSPSVSSNVGGDIRTLSNYLDVNSETTPQTGMFSNLFYKNKYIVDASNLRLPYTTLARSCYNSMFQGCTSLTSAPELPATTLANYCYYSMFQGCTSLTTAPVLPATTLASSCYDGMFYGCTSLTTAPALPATTLASSCYYSMFQGCSKLNSITVYADDISASYCTDSWLSGVASTGTFNNYGSATYIANSPSGIPNGWTEVKN